MPKASENAALLLTQKVLEPKPIEPLPRFSASAATGGCQLFVNSRCRLPFGVSFQQLASIESCLIKPKKFTGAIASSCFL
jgi:hypothetical protein